MSANFTIENSKLSYLDKFIIVYNLSGLNQVFNQGFCFKKSKIKTEKTIAGVWKIKSKK